MDALEALAVPSVEQLVDLLPVDEETGLDAALDSVEEDADDTAPVLLGAAEAFDEDDGAVILVDVGFGAGLLVACGLLGL